MKWLTQYLTSSIGRKMTMSLTGLFLITFLIVHLLGNFQLLKNDNGESFNKYTYFMTHNPLIKAVSYGLYLFIILHTIQGLALYFANKKAKGLSYAGKSASPGVSWSSKNMALLGTLILFFLIIHMGDFWFKMKSGVLTKVAYEDFLQGEPIYNLYDRVAAAFKNPILIASYIIGQLVLFFHLSHGFQSAFQTLGWNHPKYMPIVKGIGLGYAVLVPLGFAIIPVIFYVLNQ
ncbi:MAG: succinate dehydrogenase cytochrome b subunit [Saprospiraceae bacterium]|nr:succinate dehydrogenase cytochrome b subunit [Saprospiraceae bacterium]